MNGLPAQLPPGGLVGLEPSWSRLVDSLDHRGDARRWHLLDNQVAGPRLTLLCVHGNPSWSYLWRKIIAHAPDDLRVIAIDQLEMGYSERSGRLRRLGDRIDDLDELSSTLDIDSPVVTVAHDWGGPISLGWALRHVDRLAGVVLLNTAVHQPDDAAAPAVIRAVRTGPLLRRATVDTNAFLRAAIALSRPPLDAAVRDALLAPYRSAERRDAIGQFVEDIPLDRNHPSHDVLSALADGLDALADVPALLLWGPDDPVFSDRYLHDLEARLPHADVHRFVGAGHFVSEDAPVAEAVHAWVDASLRDRAPTATIRTPSPTPRKPLCSAIDELARSQDIAVAERHGHELTTISFADLAERVDALATGLGHAGVRPGQRVAVMVPPGIDLSVIIFACFRIGAVLVLVDAGLGPRNMSRALQAADPDHLIGITKALTAARAFRWPGRPIAVSELDAVRRRMLGASDSLPELEARGAGGWSGLQVDDDAAAAVVFTSGSTGPSKGVLYTHRQLQAQRDLLAELYDIDRDDRLVAAFAPFALYGPALGITSIVPDMDVTKPSTLDATSLAEAVGEVEATMVFASPAALQNVVETAGSLEDRHRMQLGRVRLLLSAGAPVHRRILASAAELLGDADSHTPYGMTEVLPVADISLAELEGTTRQTGAPAGTCVGRPAPLVTLAVSALDAEGRSVGEPDNTPYVVGEVLVSADHVKERYDRLWFTEHRSAQPPGWHRTGDVGWLDHEGALWIGGRIAHVITTADGCATPVGIEHAAESVDMVRRAAAVGVGPIGTQVIAVVVEGPVDRAALVAPFDLTESIRTTVRDATGFTIAAVLNHPSLPVDRRHNSKIDRTEVARWATYVLAGRNSIAVRARRR